MGLSGYQIFGLISLALAGLMMYWLSSPNPSLESDPLNSVALIIFTLVFLASGIFLIVFGYMLTDNGD